MRNFRGTTSSVEMLKGHMFTERSGTPGLVDTMQIRLKQI